MPKVTQLVGGGAGILTQARNQNLPSQSSMITCACHRCGVVLYSFIQGLFIEYIVLDNGGTRLIGQGFCPQRTHSTVEKR